MTPRWFTRPLTPEGIAVVQRKVGALATGTWNDDTEARVRGVQMVNKIPPTGEVDEETAEILGEDPAHGQVPAWFEGDLNLNDHSQAVCAVRCRLGVPNKSHDRYDADVEAAVRRFQSGHDLPVTGVVDLATAIELGDCICWEK